MKTPARTPRSYLFLPATRLDRLDKALASGADAVILDLEDAVAAADKAAARDSLARAYAALAAAADRLWLRINPVNTPEARDDLALLSGLPPMGVMCPKAERLDELRALPPGRAVLALIETAQGLALAPHLGEAPAVVGLAFGSIDYALDLGGIDPDDREALRHARSTLVWAARMAGLPAPVDGVTARLDNPDALQADVLEARRLGFGAKLCIHPAQVAVVNTAFAPTAAELAWAQRVVAAAGSGAATQLDGTMVDRPVLERAQRLLARAQSAG